MKKLFCTFALLLFVGSMSLSLAQSYKSLRIGKMFNQKEARELFGEVKSSIKINPNVLKNALKKADDFVALKVKNGKLMVVNQKRQSLTDEVTTLDVSETVYIFSTSVIEDFLSAIGESTVAVETRTSTLTLTAADTTLEFSMTCPPICFE